jgi:putative inorganic carbon (hco3(-)) transporter
VSEASRSYISEVRRLAAADAAAPASAYGSIDQRGKREVVNSVTQGELGSAAPDGVVVRLRALDMRAYWEVFRTESFAFKMACIYLMIEYVRPQTIWPWLDIMPLGLVSLAGGVAVVLTSSAERSAKPYGSQMPLLMTFLCLIVVSIIASQYPTYGWSNLPLYISWVMAYFLITRAVNNERRFMFFYVLFLLFSFKMSQHGFRSWALSGFRFNKEGVSGAPGWFNNSGEVGIQMCIFLPMTLYFMSAGWSAWGWLRRTVMIVVVTTIVGTVVGSSSRGALIGAAVVLLWMLFRSRHKARGLLAVAAVAAVVALVLPPQFYGRLDQMGDDNSSQTRLQYWAYGWELMKQHPLLGVGYFNWFPTYAAHLIAIGETRRPEICHNIFIQAGSELGFPGVVLLVALIIVTFVLNFRTRKLLAGRSDGRFLTQLALGLDAGMIGYVITAQFVTVLYYPYMWIDLALVVALHNSVRRQAGAAIAANPAADGARGLVRA